ncbi:MAG: lipid-A-disaccharide synthase [Candidatus Omnitrophica bacterium]|nr:lipid-A-disaccharide synthase [Candidatus Omnitrophota bacterium]
MSQRKIFLIAGEASGDTHGAHLVRELKRLDPSLVFYGLGGKAMQGEGVNIFFDLPSIAAIGLGDVLRQYFVFRKIFFQTLDRVLHEIKPDAVILIDYPGFNLRFAKKINRRIPVLYYISPQVWAWGARRIKTIARVVQRMLAILPFEVGVYRQSGLDCRFVGHPLIDLVKPSRPAEELKKEWKLDGSPVISLLPGSRESEVRRILPVLLKSAEILEQKFPNARFILGETGHLPASLYDAHLASSRIRPLRLRNRMYDVLSVSDFALVASGTATLETAISLVPFLIVYKTAFSTYFLGRRLIRIPYIGLANVLAGKKIVPEFIQHEAEPARIAAEAERLLRDAGARRQMLDSLREVRNSLGEPGASGRAAHSVLEFISNL